MKLIVLFLQLMFILLLSCSQPHITYHSYAGNSFHVQKCETFMKLINTQKNDFREFGIVAAKDEVDGKTIYYLLLVPEYRVLGKNNLLNSVIIPLDKVDSLILYLNDLIKKSNEKYPEGISEFYEYKLSPIITEKENDISSESNALIPELPITSILSGSGISLSTDSDFWIPELSIYTNISKSGFILKVYFGKNREYDFTLEDINTIEQLQKSIENAKTELDKMRMQ